jgi:hypothetical protein
MVHTGVLAADVANTHHSELQTHKKLARNATTRKEVAEGAGLKLLAQPAYPYKLAG